MAAAPPQDGGRALACPGYARGGFDGQARGQDRLGDGRGSGIGEAAAMALAEEGATLVLTGRRKAPLEEVAARIRADGRHRACANPPT